MQEYGLQLLMAVEDIDRGKEQALALKRAMVSRPDIPLHVAMPEVFDDPEVVDADSDEGEAALASGAELDLSEVTWESPSTGATAESVMNDLALLEQAMAANTTVMVGEDGEDPGGEWL